MAVTIDRRPVGEVEYPTSDGKPMAETDKHRALMMYLIYALTVYFRGRPDVYVSGNNLVFYQEGERLRLYDPLTREWLPSPEELAESLEEEARRVEEQRERAEAAEAELARLRAELDARSRSE